MNQVNDFISKLTIRIRGAAPGMLVNPATQDLLRRLHGGSEGSEAIVKGRPYETVAREKVCRLNEDPKGPIGIKTDCLFAAIVEAGKQVKRNAKSNYTNGKGSVLGGRISIDRDFLEFIPESLQKEGTVNGEGWVVDARRGRIPSSGVAVCIVRPRFPQWEAEFSVFYDPKLLPHDKAFSLIEIAGRDIGLGDFRVACKGRYGKFEIVGQKLENVPTSETGRVTLAEFMAANADLIKGIVNPGSVPLGDEPIEDEDGDEDGDEDENGGD